MQDKGLGQKKILIICTNLIHFDTADKIIGPLKLISVTKIGKKKKQRKAFYQLMTIETLPKLYKNYGSEDRIFVYLFVEAISSVTCLTEL